MVAVAHGKPAGRVTMQVVGRFESQQAAEDLAHNYFDGDQRVVSAMVYDTSRGVIVDQVLA